MVDKNARREAGELLRHFAAGQITNNEFEDRFPRRCDDLAVSELRAQAWYLYSDLRAYRLVGKDRLSAETRRAVGRWVLFLRTDLEYEWPVRTLSSAVLLTFANFCTFGIVGRLCRSRFARYGEIDAWPFLRRSDYATALESSSLIGRVT